MKALKRANSNLNHAGQALLELLVSGGFLFLLLSGTGWILQLIWQRGQCTYLVFESTRSALSGTPYPPSNPLQIQVTESSSSVSGQSSCGKAGRPLERVGLRKLEGMRQWE